MTTTTATKPAPKKRTKRSFSAEEKTRAVLSIWTERRKPADVCRELTITAALLDLWQKKAMEAILTAMEPRQGPEARAPLPPRIEKILNRQVKIEPVSKLVRRLSELQDGKEPAKKPAPVPSNPKS
ncbi:transposase [Coraliomargarita parva]|uniref:transposase n=1 Tax=Coraliomargarita parva TaxID=3014050 RepID=UPI003CE47EDC